MKSYETLHIVRKEVSGSLEFVVKAINGFRPSGGGAEEVPEQQEYVDLPEGRATSRGLHEESRECTFRRTISQSADQSTQRHQPDPYNVHLGAHPAELHGEQKNNSLPNVN